MHTTPKVLGQPRISVCALSFWTYEELRKRKAEKVSSSRRRFCSRSRLRTRQMSRLWTCAHGTEASFPPWTATQPQSWVIRPEGRRGSTRESWREESEWECRQPGGGRESARASALAIEGKGQKKNTYFLIGKYLFSLDRFDYHLPASFLSATIVYCCMLSNWNDCCSSLKWLAKNHHALRSPKL